MLAVAAVFALRAFRIGRSFDLFIDEITYLRISTSVASTLTVKLYDDPFYLHPPAFFFLQAAYLKLFPASGNIVEQIHHGRLLDVACAAGTAGALVWIARRLGGWAAAALVALMFALDPFIIKMNSYNLLDTPAIWWITAGYALLVGGLVDAPGVLPLWPWLARRVPWLGRWLRRLPAWSAPPDAPVALGWGRTGLAGLCFGLALLTKDMTAFLSLLPLGICWVGNWSLRRRTSAAIGTITLATYSVYPLTVWLVGEWPHFAKQKLRGFQRFSGAVKETGFKRHGGPSLLESVIAKLDQFGTTYAIIAAGVVAVLVLLLLGGRASRLIGVWTANSYALLGYCVVFGTLEEQFFYFLVVPALLASALAVTTLLRLAWWTPRGRRRAGWAVSVAASAFAVWGALHWAQIHLTPHNGYQQALTFIETVLPPKSSVASSSETGQFMLGDHSGPPWGKWHSLGELNKHTPDYVLISTKQLSWDYGDDAKPLQDWLTSSTTEVWRMQTEGAGALILYRMPAATP